MGREREVDVWATYNKIKVVGRGAFGSAYLCRGKKSTQLVVVKELFRFDNNL
jgi:serine/threonine protein kinase